ncbi:MAG: hypothetical protein GF398_03580 [Chitinivibrionales bacterium]|nr:hypothetical protein [Chitinivibrionales bacterium]
MREEALIDKQRALGEMGGDLEIYDEVAAAYLEETPRLLQELSADIANGDATSLERHAHSLKSTSRTVGAMLLGSHAEKLEFGARRANLENPASMLAEIQRVYQHVQAQLTQQDAGN